MGATVASRYLGNSLMSDPNCTFCETAYEHAAHVAGDREARKERAIDQLKRRLDKGISDRVMVETHPTKRTRHYKVREFNGQLYIHMGYYSKHKVILSDLSDAHPATEDYPFICFYERGSAPGCAT
jgi:hypothetical protein